MSLQAMTTTVATVCSSPSASSLEIDHPYGGNVLDRHSQSRRRLGLVRRDFDALGIAQDRVDDLTHSRPGHLGRVDLICHGRSVDGTDHVVLAQKARCGTAVGHIGNDDFGAILRAGGTQTRMGEASGYAADVLSRGGSGGMGGAR